MNRFARVLLDIKREFLHSFDSSIFSMSAVRRHWGMDARMEGVAFGFPLLMCILFFVPRPVNANQLSYTH